MSSEEILIEAVIQKRNDAVKVIYDRYAPVLLGLCCRYCNSREDAEDVLQEGFMKIIKNLSSFRAQNNGSLIAWMKRIMVNTALNHIRSRNRYVISQDLLPAVNGSDFSDEPSFFESILGKIGKEKILSMISSLPPGYRAVFNLYVFEEYSHKEIAAAMNCTENTSKSQLSKARAMLRNKIEHVLQHEIISEYGKVQASIG
jgi:RNA polymerase sigma-70 factor (ECF subfamily)